MLLIGFSCSGKFDIAVLKEGCEELQDYIASNSALQFDNSNRNRMDRIKTNRYLSQKNAKPSFPTT